MNKYEYLLKDIKEYGFGSMKCFGQSMVPILESGCLNWYKPEKKYRVGDVVLCKVRGRYIDAHKITKVDGDRYLISNNHGHDNGWTRTILARVYATSDSKGIRYFGEPKREVLDKETKSALGYSRVGRTNI